MTLIERLRNVDQIDDFARLDAADALERIQNELNRPGGGDWALRRVCEQAMKMGDCTDSSCARKEGT